MYWQTKALFKWHCLSLRLGNFAVHISRQSSPPSASSGWFSRHPDVTGSPDSHLKVPSVSRSDAPSHRWDGPDSADRRELVSKNLTRAISLPLIGRKILSKHSTPPPTPNSYTKCAHEETPPFLSLTSTQMHTWIKDDVNHLLYFWATDARSALR